MTEREIMKRLLALLLAGALAFALVGCDTKTEPAEPPERPVADEPATEEPEPEPKQDPKPSSNSSSGFDESQALGLDETSKDNPAPFGTWVATMQYSTEISADSLAYVRVTAIERDQAKVQEFIDTYNASDSYYVIDPLEPEDLEYLILQYEVYFPDDFPVSETVGITTPEVSFSLTTYEGGGFDRGDGTVYIGLGTGHDISPDIAYDAGLKAGETFTDGLVLFEMVKGTTDFLVETDYFVDDKMHEVYFKG
jgi:hypothetical protein